MTEASESDLAILARKHGLSEAAVKDAAAALRRGNGRQAQFHHPDLGGMGQWSTGGMLMIGDMFNHDLKARVDALFSDLASLAPGSGDAVDMSHTGRWPVELGQPSSAGSQNDMHYAVFPKARRLAVERDGERTLYDMADHQISGVSQQQSGDQTLSFTGPGGTVSLAELTVVEGNSNSPAALGRNSAQDAPTGSDASEDIAGRIGKLHDLLGKGALTQEEYDSAKRKLLDQL